MSLKPEHVMERGGRQFVLYVGLLDLAHEMGLKSINTTLLQTPSVENNNMAICYAVVTLEKDGVVRTFTGIGDADATNVNRMIVPHITRMAETRAKARALRDATNIGMTAFEELGGDDITYEEPREQRHSMQPTPIRQDAAPRSSSESGSDAGASVAQIKAIFAIGKNSGLKEDEIEQNAVAKYGKKPNLLTKRQASEFIDALQKR